MPNSVSSSNALQEINDIEGLKDFVNTLTPDIGKLGGRKFVSVKKTEEGASYEADLTMNAIVARFGELVNKSPSSDENNKTIEEILNKLRTLDKRANLELNNKDFLITSLTNIRQFFGNLFYNLTHTGREKVLKDIEEQIHPHVQHEGLEELDLEELSIQDNPTETVPKKLDLYALDIQVAKDDASVTTMEHNYSTFIKKAHDTAIDGVKVHSYYLDGQEQDLDEYIKLSKEYEESLFSITEALRKQKENQTSAPDNGMKSPEAGYANTTQDKSEADILEKHDHFIMCKKKFEECIQNNKQHVIEKFKNGLIEIGLREIEKAYYFGFVPNEIRNALTVERIKLQKLQKLGNEVDPLKFIDVFRLKFFEEFSRLCSNIEGLESGSLTKINEAINQCKDLFLLIAADNEKEATKNQ